MNVCHLLSMRAKQSPSKTALIDRRSRVSYQDLDGSCAQLATTLHRQGVRPGDAALILVPLSTTFYVIVTAVLRLGAVPVLVDPGRGRSHVERCCRLVQPRVFVGSPRSHLLLATSPALRKITLRFSTSRLVPSSHRLLRTSITGMGITPVDNDASALITFTSGSTGMPKAIVRSHGFLLAQHKALHLSLGHADDEVVLSALPIFVLSHLAAGLTCVIPDCDLRRPGDIAPDALIAQLATHAVGAVEAPPALLEQIVRRCVEKGMRLAVRRFLIGGAPVFPRLMDELATISPGCEVNNIYGSSEAEPIAQISASAISAEDICAMKTGRGLLVGTPIPSIDLRVLSPSWARTIASISDLEDASLPPGQIGEVIVCGDHVLSGYLCAQEIASKIRVDGIVWHRTGDIGYIDSYGRLWLLGRVDPSPDGQANLYPLSVETAMSFFPAVERSAFFALNDKRILALQLDPRCQPDLRRFQKLLREASVDSIWEVPHIPTDRRHNSKIDYKGLTSHRRQYRIWEINDGSIVEQPAHQKPWITMPTLRTIATRYLGNIRQRVWRFL